MKFNTILITSVSASFELDTDTCYYSDELYSVYLNDELYQKDARENVFSIFNLYPNTRYVVSVKTAGCKEEIVFETKNESTFANVKRFGAVGNGIHDDTLAIQTAIMSIPKDGRIVFTKGKYYTKPLFLRSDITLEFKEGAVLLGNTTREAYSVIPGYLLSTNEKTEYHLNAWEGNPLETFASLITALNVKNITLVGEGLIDGNAQNGDWWINPKEKNISWRPRLFFFNQCENITFHGIKISNSPAWHIHPFYSKNLHFIHITINTAENSPNTDGIDPESCTNVEIVGAKISVGDDCVVLKSGKLYLGTYYKAPTKDVNIRNCHMINGHGAVVLGSEISSGVQEVNVSQCLFEDTDRGLRIKTRRGRGSNSVVDNISFKNIKMKRVKAPITMNMHYRCDPDGDSEYVQTNEYIPIDSRTPYLGSFLFEDIVCDDVHYSGLYCVGLPEQKIKSITLKNVRFTFSNTPEEGKPIMRTHIDQISAKGAYFACVELVQFEKVTFNGNRNDEVTVKSVDTWKRGY